MGGGGKHEKRRNPREKKILREGIKNYFVQSSKLFLDRKSKTKGKPDSRPIFHQFPWNSLEFLNKTSKQHWEKSKEVETISGMVLWNLFYDK